MVLECLWVTASEGVDSWAGEDLCSNGFPPSAESEPPGVANDVCVRSQMFALALGNNGVIWDEKVS